MRNEQRWDAIQGITGIYTSVLATVSLFYPPGDVQSVWQKVIRVDAQPTLLIAVLALGLSTAIPAIRRWRTPASAATLPPVTDILAFMGGALEKRYKRLAHEIPEQVRYPLKPTTVPQYGAPWAYHHVELEKLKFQVATLRASAEHVWARMGWPKDELIPVDENVYVLDLIAALERFQTLLAQRSPQKHSR